MRSGSMAGIAACFPKTAVVLGYHSICDRRRSTSDSINVGVSLDVSVFEQHMEVIARRFRPVTLDDILHFSRGEFKLPARSVAVTFDDGFADNFTIARPILNRLGIRGAFYVTVASIDSGIPPWFVRLRRAFQCTQRTEWTDESDGGVWVLDDKTARHNAFKSRIPPGCMHYRLRARTARRLYGV